MATAGKKKGTSVQTYRHSAKLVIRLEYDQADERQSVFLNGELRSSFRCPVALRATHTFRGHDAISEERGRESVWRINFAVEQNTFRIRYQICRQNKDGEDTKWSWWDRNIEPEEWTRFPEFDEGSQIEVQCDDCGTAKTCPKCETASAECDTCGTELECPKCNPQTIYDAALTRAVLDRRAALAYEAPESDDEDD